MQLNINFYIRYDLGIECNFQLRDGLCNLWKNNFTQRKRFVLFHFHVYFWSTLLILSFYCLMVCLYDVYWIHGLWKGYKECTSITRFLFFPRFFHHFHHQHLFLHSFDLPKIEVEACVYCTHTPRRPYVNEKWKKGKENMHQENLFHA